MFFGKPDDMPSRELCVGFTGHRPGGLPWGRNESDPYCKELKQRLAQTIEQAYAEGARYFLSGMAEGVDTYAAEAVLQLAESCPDIRLIAVFPYGEGAFARTRRIAARAYKTVSLYPDYVTGCHLVRDRFIVNSCSRLICVYCSGRGGTAATMKMAAESGVRMTVLRV